MFRPNKSKFSQSKLKRECKRNICSRSISRLVVVVVTWVEHVEVDDKSRTHRLYRDLISSGHAYGAKRWIATLERMCERFVYTMGSRATPSHELEGVINLPEGRISILKLCQRMVKDFCAMLSMADKLDFPNSFESNNSVVRVSVRKSNDVSQPHASIVSAATSLWLPLSRDTLFNFFKDEKTRPQWDVVSSGHLVNEIAHISSGTHPGNYASIIQPFVPHEKNMLMLQENYIDPLGALVVYAPIGLQAITAAINGEDTERTPVLPSGFTISGDGHSLDKLGSTTRDSTSASSGNSRQGGSLVTVAFQILVNAQSRQMNMEAITTVNTLIRSTVQKIKAAFNCSENLE